MSEVTQQVVKPEFDFRELILFFKELYCCVSDIQCIASVQAFPLFCLVFQEPLITVSFFSAAAFKAFVGFFNLWFSELNDVCRHDFLSVSLP